MRWRKYIRKYWCPVPLPANHLRYRIIRIYRDMKTAKIRVTWKKSVSTDVIGQRVEISRLKIGSGDPVYEDYQKVELPVDIEQYDFTGDEKETFLVNIVTSDGTWEAKSGSLQIVVPDLSVPAPATGLGWSIVEVIEKLPEY